MNGIKNIQSKKMKKREYLFLVIIILNYIFFIILLINFVNLLTVNFIEDEPEIVYLVIQVGNLIIQLN